MSRHDSKVPLPNLDGDVDAAGDRTCRSWIRRGRRRADRRRSRSGVRRAGPGLGGARRARAWTWASCSSSGPARVLELDRKVGEAIDIYVNNRLVARGEVVLVEDKLGVTMTEIIKTERSG